jgi:indolepyruvate ferredoxin oxidoreductase
MGELARAVTPATHAVAVQIARIPEQIRGYGHVKEASLEAARRREAELLAEFRRQPIPVAAE